MQPSPPKGKKNRPAGTTIPSNPERDWFYCCMLEDKPDDVSLSRHVRLKLAQFLLEDRNNLRYKYVPEYKQLGKLAKQFAKFAW